MTAGVAPSVVRGLRSPAEAWSEDDRVEMIEYVRFKRQVCPGCGTRHDEWVGEDGMPLDPAPYVAHLHRCLGCATRHQASRSSGRDDPATRTVLVPPEVAASLSGGFDRE